MEQHPRNNLPSMYNVEEITMQIIWGKMYVKGLYNLNFRHEGYDGFVQRNDVRIHQTGEV